MSKISLDLGGSGIRVRYMGRDNRVVSSDLSSRFVKIKDDSRLVPDIADKFSDFQIIESASEGVIGRYARGEASRYFDGVQSVVDNSELKVNQVATYVNCLHAMAIYVYKVFGPTILADIGRVGIVIPVREYYSDSAEIPKRILAGYHVVKFPLLKKEVGFFIKPENIKVGGEGAVVAFTMRRDPRYRDLISGGNGVIVDVGYRSTDIVIFSAFKADAKSCVSKRKGGINMESKLAADLDDINRGVSSNQLMQVMSTGCVGREPVYDIVKYCKETFGSVLRQDINAVATTAEISLKALDYIIPVGRPFDDGDGSCGSLIQEAIREMREDIAVVECKDLEFANVNAMFELLG